MLAIACLPLKGHMNMGAKRKELQCGFCDSIQTFRKARIDHFFHLVITTITLGVWLPIWLVLLIHREFKPWVCRACRRKHRAA